MALTTSLAFPNMFNVANNSVAVYEDLKSVTNRTRLLILSGQTELYNNPNFGVGLKQYLWQYNSENTRAIIEKNIRDQIDLHEPCAIAKDTIFSDGLKYTGNSNNQAINPATDLNLTIGITTKFETTATIDLNSANPN